jgi:hypothetical protein
MMVITEKRFPLKNIEKIFMLSNVSEQTMFKWKVIQLSKSKHLYFCTVNYMKRISVIPFISYVLKGKAWLADL